MVNKYCLTNFLLLFILINLFAVTAESVFPLFLAKVLAEKASEDPNVLQDVGDADLAPQLFEGLKEDAISPILLSTATRDEPLWTKPLHVDLQHTAAVPLDVFHFICNHSVFQFVYVI